MFNYYEMVLPCSTPTSPGPGPAAGLLFFACPKKSRQKKRHPRWLPLAIFAAAYSAPSTSHGGLREAVPSSQSPQKWRAQTATGGPGKSKTKQETGC